MIEPARVLPTLYIGAAPATRDDAALLARRGVSAVLSLQTDGDLRNLGLTWEVVLGWYRREGLAAERVPIEDWSPEAVIAHLSQAVEALERLLDAGHTVYLHCTAGVNRSPSVALAYLRRIRREPLGRALARITRSRPQAQPYPEVLALLR